MSIRIGSVCTGYGGLDKAVQQVFGGNLAWASDIDPGACRIIAHRMPGVPNIGDLTTTDWTTVEPVDIYIGGYPCQPFSTAGHRKGTDDERHLWPFIASALRVLRPRIAIFENVAGHLRLGFDTVLADLARLGFDAEWCLVRASEVGAPHPRKRLFLVATAANARGLDAERRGVAGILGEQAPAEPREGNQRERAGDAARHRGEAVANAADFGHERGGDARRGGNGSADHRIPAPHTDRVGRGPDQLDVQQRQPHVAWGRFALAVQRWEHILGRPAPRATDDRNRLSPAFVEWMMGLPAGHVTDVPRLTRTQQLKALGNGVVPQQAAAAIRLLADRAGVAA